MNILLQDGLPIEIDGIPISPDFRNMILFDMAMHDESLGEAERVRMGLHLLYPGFSGEVDKAGNPIPAPESLEKAAAGLMAFFRRNKQPDVDGEGSSAPRAFDFEQDAGMLYSSFLEAYGIALADYGYMHWWEFMALLEGLPEKTRMARAMYFRTVDISGMGNDERSHVLKMRKLFAIKSGGSDLTPEERERQLKERIQKKIASAKR